MILRNARCNDEISSKHTGSKYGISALDSQEVVFVRTDVTCAVQKSKNLYWNLMPTLRAPNRGRVCVRGANERGVSCRGKGYSDPLSRHLLYFREQKFSHSPA